MIAAVGVAAAAIFWLGGLVNEQQAFDAGAPQFAVAAWLLQWSLHAALLWLLGRGIVAHLPARVSESVESARTDPKTASLPGE